MNYYTRRFIKPGNLNAANRLFGGQLLSWIDEESAIFASCQMKRDHIVTKTMSEINFMKSSCAGDVIEFGLELVRAGRTSVTVRCHVRNKNTHEGIVSVDEIVFVAIDAKGKPVAHGYVAQDNNNATPLEPVLLLEA